VPLAYWVLDQALRQCRLWQDAGHCLSVAVNLAGRNLRDPFLARRIRDLLLEHRVPAHKLCIELTESSIMRDVQQTINVLRNLHGLGVRISLDDFGTGYSSLSSLAQLPIDEIKIDRSFVQRMAENSTNATIVASTIGLGRSLGIRVVIEGVEDAATDAMLDLLDVDAVQGFHFSEPLPADQLDAYLLQPLARNFKPMLPTAQPVAP
jgi:EAL domain-containing protein (putative c-di-GMP-specific phosphodiesterase class I)